MGQPLEAPMDAEKTHMYWLEIKPQMTANDLVKKIKEEESDMLVKQPEILEINHLTVVKWSSGGMCPEHRFIEVVGHVNGHRNNYRFSGGCAEDNGEVFNYFEKVIKTMELIQ